MGEDRTFTPLQLPSPVVGQIPIQTLEPRVLRPREVKESAQGQVQLRVDLDLNSGVSNPLASEWDVRKVHPERTVYLRRPGVVEERGRHIHRLTFFFFF